MSFQCSAAGGGELRGEERVRGRREEVVVRGRVERSGEGKDIEERERNSEGKDGEEERRW